VVGLTAIFSAAAVPIMIMGVSLEVAKLVCATWIKQYWSRVPRLMKTYMVTAVTVLMLITSMGIFGFLSKAHNDQNLVSGDVGAKLAIFDEKIATARGNIEADRKQLTQMDAAVDQVLARSTSETGADKANAIRNSQKRDRAALARDIETNQRIISQLNDEAAPIRAENRKVEAEVGPIKYIAAFIYGTAPDASMLERAVTWIIIMIVVVFDPLAVIMLLASQMTFAWSREQKRTQDEDIAPDPVLEEVETTPESESVEPEYVAVDGEMTEDQIDQINTMLADLAESAEELPVEESAEPESVAETKPSWSGFGFPMSSVFGQPRVETVIEESAENESEELPVVVPEPPMEFEPAKQQPESRPARLEAAPGRNRGVMHTHLAVEADNSVELGRPASSGFGSEFPANPQKGDVFLRVDYLPNRLFKFNDKKWIEVDKSQTDVYAYEDEYIKHLVDEIDAGRYDPDILTDVEREQIRQFLEKNS